MEKVNGIAQSIVEKAPELEKPVRRAQSVASKFKQAIEKFKTTLKNKFSQLNGKIGKLKNTLTELLKKSWRLITGIFYYLCHVDVHILVE